MQASGYDFVNVGGQRIQKLSVNTNSSDVDQASNGELLATLAYNPYENSGRLF